MPNADTWVGPIRTVSKQEQVKNPVAEAASGAAQSDAATKPQRVRPAYVDQLQSVRDMAKEQLDMLAGLVQAKEAQLRDAGLGHAIVMPQRDYLPPTYSTLGCCRLRVVSIASLPPSLASPPTKQPPAAKKKKSARGAKATRKRRKADWEDDEDEDGANVDSDADEGAAPGYVDPFDGAFFRLVSDFNALDSKASQVSAAALGLSAKQSTQLTAILDVAASVGSRSSAKRVAVKREPQPPAVAADAPAALCTCPNCPHKRRAEELQKNMFF